MNLIQYNSATWLTDLRDDYLAGELETGSCTKINTPRGTYLVDENQDRAGLYLHVSATLPDGVWAEIDGSDVGELTGYRIYKDK